MTLLLRKHLLWLAALLLLPAVYMLAGITCPILALTGHPCPTCGTTRAIGALLRGNLAQYVNYQPMALPLAAAMVLCLHLPYIKGPWRRIAQGAVVAVLLINLCLYFSGR